MSAAVAAVGTAPRGAVEGGAPRAAGSFTDEQVSRLVEDGARLSWLLTVEDGASLADSDRVGVLVDPATGERRDVPRVRSVTLASVLAGLPDDEHEDARRVWDLTCKGETGPGKVAQLADSIRAKWGHPWATAWQLAWTVDAAQLREKTEGCGSMTREVSGRTPKGEAFVSLSRARCGSTRCPHCGRLVVARRWQQRLEAQAARDRTPPDGSAPRPWAMLTLTLDPTGWAEAHGVAPGVTAAVMAQRWVGRAWAELAEHIRETWPGTEMLRAVELHDSQWPHVHTLVRGGLVEAMRAEGAARWESWDEMAAYGKDQRERQRAGELRVARCPTPATRKAVSALATLHGFGLRLDLTPIAGEDMVRTGHYVAKGPQAHGKAKSIVDVDPGGAVPGELAKAGQRVAHLLARGVRCWAEAGRFLEAPPPAEPASGGTIEAVRVLAAPLDRIAAELRAAGHEVAGEVIVADFGGPVPDKGQRRPRVVEAVAVEVSVYDLLERWARDTGRRKPRDGPG